MRRFRLLSASAFGLLLALSAAAQDIEVPTASDRIATGVGAVLRGLDRVAGTSEDIVLPLGGSADVGHLRVMVQDCRYPEENPAAEAYAWIEIFDIRADEMIFAGWMIASSPALNALDHRRYDLWLLRCTTS
jgi:hypothetical protein